MITTLNLRLLQNIHNGYILRHLLPNLTHPIKRALLKPLTIRTQLPKTALTDHMSAKK